MTEEIKVNEVEVEEVEAESEIINVSKKVKKDEMMEMMKLVRDLSDKVNKLESQKVEEKSSSDSKVIQNIDKAYKEERDKKESRKMQESILATEEADKQAYDENLELNEFFGITFLEDQQNYINQTAKEISKQGKESLFKVKDMQTLAMTGLKISSELLDQLNDVDHPFKSKRLLLPMKDKTLEEYGLLHDNAEDEMGATKRLLNKHINGEIFLPYELLKDIRDSLYKSLKNEGIESQEDLCNIMTKETESKHSTYLTQSDNAASAFDKLKELFASQGVKIALNKNSIDKLVYESIETAYQNMNSQSYLKDLLMSESKEDINNQKRAIEFVLTYCNPATTFTMNHLDKQIGFITKKLGVPNEPNKITKEQKDFNKEVKTLLDKAIKSRITSHKGMHKNKALELNEMNKLAIAKSKAINVINNR